MITFVWLKPGLTAHRFRIVRKRSHAAGKQHQSQRDLDNHQDVLRPLMSRTGKKLLCYTIADDSRGCASDLVFVR